MTKQKLTQEQVDMVKALETGEQSDLHTLLQNRQDPLNDNEGKIARATVQALAEAGFIAAPEEGEK